MDKHKFKDAIGLALKTLGACALVILFFIMMYDITITSPNKQSQSNIEKCGNENITYVNIDDAHYNCCGLETIKGSNGWQRANVCHAVELLPNGMKVII